MCMKLSTRARYALRMMVEMARLSHESDNPISLSHVAETTLISRRYLEQLAIALKNSSLIKGKTGKGGGYRLAKPPGRITVGQIVEAAIGPINIVDCVLEPNSCFMAGNCSCRSVYCEINENIVKSLHNLTLDGLDKKNRTSKTRIKTRIKTKSKTDLCTG